MISRNSRRISYMNPAKILPVRCEDSNEPYFSILYHRNGGRIVTRDYFSRLRRGIMQFPHVAQKTATIFCSQNRENADCLVTCDDAADLFSFYSEENAARFRLPCKGRRERGPEELTALLPAKKQSNIFFRRNH